VRHNARCGLYQLAVVIRVARAVSQLARDEGARPVEAPETRQTTAFIRRMRSDSSKHSVWKLSARIAHASTARRCQECTAPDGIAVRVDPNDGRHRSAGVGGCPVLSVQTPAPGCQGCQYIRTEQQRTRRQADTPGDQPATE
jgi:hypothetical protein